MEMIVKLFLPLSLAFIMFSLGITLKFQDFARVAIMPKALAIGLIGQLLLLPLIAFGLLQLFPLGPALALGVMILAFSPGGVTSNMLTYIAGGSVALSVTLTAVSSVLCVATVPFLVALSAQHFLNQDALQVDVRSIAVSMALLTAAPVLIGLLLNHFAARFAYRIAPAISKIATLLLIIIVAAAIVTNLDLLIENILLLGPILIALNAIMLGIGYTFARLAKLNHPDSTAIALETGLQNGTLGITVGSMVLAGSGALPATSLASGIYVITMYFCTLPFIYWIRRGARQQSSLKEARQNS
ncbi:bile acid:sodium symporter family protein [Flexibacterium corallicola]|uniref:bile acid:sodium symporter family protein n=1 Tax=Flexibacterium corallicola TaxID=3037259 RepID=UPI00286ED7E8|nr:bile acid:sodium symporter family protein [Pseudovibrio sp. M1P-2-3]